MPKISADLDVLKRSGADCCKICMAASTPFRTSDHFENGLHCISILHLMLQQTTLIKLDRLASWLCCLAQRSWTYSHLLWRLKWLHTCAVHNNSDVLLRKMEPAAISHKHLFKRCGSLHFDRNHVSFLWEAEQQPQAF